MSLAYLTSVVCDVCGAAELTHANGATSRSRRMRGWVTDRMDGARTDWCPRCSVVRAGATQPPIPGMMASG